MARSHNKVISNTLHIICFSSLLLLSPTKPKFHNSSIPLETRHLSSLPRCVPTPKPEVKTSSNQTKTHPIHPSPNIQIPKLQPLHPNPKTPFLYPYPECRRFSPWYTECMTDRYSTRSGMCARERGRCTRAFRPYILALFKQDRKEEAKGQKKVSTKAACPSQLPQ
jgi:hypothetical protein